MIWLHKFLREAYQRVHDWLVPPYSTIIVQDALPKTLKRKVLYIVQEDGFEEQAAIVCPCGCKSTLQMNLLTDERPCWRVARHDDGTASLHPSVWRKKDCKSHFWFRRGRVVWCR